MPAVITSLKDDHLQQVRALANRTGRAEAGGCLLEGAALITQAVEAGATLRFVLAAEGASDPVASLLAEARVPVMVAKESVLRQAVRLNRSVSWLAVAELAATDNEHPYGDFALVLDNVLDPGNLGTIVRTAVGLGVADIVCTDPGTDLTSRRVLDASRAAVLRARLRRYETPTEAVRDLRARGFEVVATSGHAKTLQGSVSLSGRPVALVVGNETDGVADEVLELADHVVRIPMSGEVESLNVGVAAGISLYELRTRMALAALGPIVAELTATVSDLRDSGYVGEDVAERALTGFTEAEREQFRGFLRRIRENLRRDE